MSNPASPRPQRLLYRAYQDSAAHATDLYQLYRELYPSLPEITAEVVLEDKHSFEYCAKRKYFVLVVPYTSRYEMLVEVAFTDQRLTRRVIGGGVRLDRMETFIDAAGRLSAHTLSEIELGEIEPVAFLKNHFTYGGKECNHYGVGFVARVRNTDPDAALARMIHCRGQFIPHDDTSVPFGLLHNQRVAELARQFIEGVDFSTVPEGEIAENLRYAGRYRFHDRIVKPLFRALGRVFIGSPNLVDEKVIELLRQEPCEKFLDVACGDNKAVVEIAKMEGVRLTVGNDVSWSQVQLMAGRFGGGELRNKDSMVLFTNHDARHLPFDDGYFDFVICKNVLHHMADLDSVRRLIDQAVRVGKRTLIVEILDTKYEGMWGRIRHSYYMHFLHDAGAHFLSRDEFRTLTDLPELVERFEIPTIRGIYQFALFDARPKEGGKNP